MSAAEAEADALLRDVQRDPASVVVRAAAVLDIATTERERVVARWALGMARRELGDLRASRRELEQAWESAAGLDDLVLAGQIAVTLSLVVAYQGELTNALAILDVSEPEMAEIDLGHVHLQRGIIRYQQGALRSAIAEYEAALELLSASNDELGEARARVNLGAALSHFGRLPEARVHLLRAIELAERLDQTLMAAIANQNLAHIESLAGDLPAAFDAFERSATRFAAAHYEGPFARSLRLDHARALLQANLLDEAADAVGRSVGDARATEGDFELAESLLVAAEVHLARGDASASAIAAEESLDRFVAHDRPSWAALARSALLRARVEGAPVTGLGDDLAENAVELHGLGYRHEAVTAALRGAEVRVAQGDVDGCLRILSTVDRMRFVSPVHRAGAHKVRAMVELARGRRARARRAINQGVRVLEEHHAVLGAIELRAVAAASSDGLARLGVRMAIEDRRARDLLRQLEATRRTLSMLPSAQPPDDEVLAELLGRLRLVTSQQRDAAAADGSLEKLDRERRSLEHRIRWHVRRTPAGATSDAVEGSVDDLGDRALVEYANLDGHLYAVSVVAGRASLHDLGPSIGIRDEVDSSTFLLHRLNRSQGSAASRAAAVSTFREVVVGLEERLLPGRVRRSSRDLVVVPTGVLHGVPWSGLPSLSGRAVSVAPSLTGWAVASRRREPVERALLVAGPALSHGEREVAVLTQRYPSADVLVGGDASAERTLLALCEADIAHLACHGSFRADNPLFSTLGLADGPMTIFDIGRCARVPRTFVLSACSTAAAATVRGGALLGLASSLMLFGAGSVVAPLTPVSDERVVAVMDRLHRGLRGGDEAAAALAAAAAETDGLDPTAAAFVVMGA